MKRAPGLSVILLKTVVGSPSSCTPPPPLRPIVGGDLPIAVLFLLFFMCVFGFDAALCVRAVSAGKGSVALRVLLLCARMAVVALRVSVRTAKDRRGGDGVTNRPAF